MATNIGWVAGLTLISLRWRESFFSSFLFFCFLQHHSIELAMLMGSLSLSFVIIIFHGLLYFFITGYR